MKKIIIILSLFLLSTSCSKLNVFGFGEKKDKFAKLGINKSLWVASSNLLNKYEGTTNNLKEGNITTGWIISENNKVRFRISIYILGSERIGDNIKIFSEKEFNKNGEWQRQQVSDAFNTKLKI
ncbi:MAG: DUF3576 domain-containing protein, partial [Alphaproteobacteria bacterium]|nr:DUF3576 domain-containing protein [Alphaproteobacteria bacterium]